MPPKTVRRTVWKPRSALASDTNWSMVLTPAIARAGSMFLTRPRSADAAASGGIAARITTAAARVGACHKGK